MDIFDRLNTIPYALREAGVAVPTLKEMISQGSKIGSKAFRSGKAQPPAANADSIVGQWKEPDGNDVTEFRADGTVIERPSNGETIRGRYSLDGAILTVRLEGLAEELSFAAAI